MKVKNIKSFIDFCKSMEISDSIGRQPRIELKNKSKRPLNEEIKLKDRLDTDCFNLVEKLKKLRGEIKNIDCNLKDISTNLVFSDGKEKSEVMLIGEAPGADEDKIGKPFVGQAGKLLDKMLEFIGLSREKNFYITNIVFWRPPGNRTPNSQEIKICLPYTKKHISLIKPKLLILLGNVATKSILEIDQGITKVRGKEHFYFDESLNLKIPTRAIYHPAYLLRNPIEKKKIWDDLIDIHSFLTKNNILIEHKKND